MYAWMWFTLVIVGASAALIAFKIAHNTHRQDRDSDRLMISDAALGGGPEMVKAAGEAAEKLAKARGKAPRWRRFEGNNALPWNRPQARPTFDGKKRKSDDGADENVR